MSTQRIDTPWGPAQDKRPIGEGIVCYSTASHGGYYVPPEKLAEMPAGFADGLWAGPGWFEEDQDWALVALAFPHLFDDYAVYCAVETGRSDYLGAKCRAWLTQDPRGRLVDTRAAEFFRHNRDKYRIGGMSTAGKGWKCHATTLDGSRSLWFESAEYPRTRGPLFTVDEIEAAGARIIEAKAAAAA
jgi:Domain of unknown function (DUF7007)